MSGLRTKIAKKASKLLEAQAELPEAPAGDLSDLPADAPAEKDGDLAKTVKDLSDKIDALAEALEQLIVIEEEEGQDDLEDLKKDEDEKKDKDVTKDEMGLEAPELTATAAADAAPQTVADAFAKDESDKAMQKLEAPAPQISKVKPCVIPTMLKLADIAFDLKNDKWLVIDASDETNEKPVYEIAKGENGADFATAAFVETLIKRMQSDGVDAVLTSVGAVEYSDPAKQAEADKATPELPKLPTPPVPPAAKKEEEKKDEKVTVPVVKAADVQRKFVRAFNLALTAMNKNLIENPLKGAFAEKLTALGMDDGEAVRVIEAAFRAGSFKHFAAAIAQTEKYLSMSDEAFVETESMISDVNVVEPSFTASQRKEVEEEAQDLRVRASRNSLPITTASEHATEKRDLLGAALPKPSNWAKKDIFRKVNK